jgi:hypothetical protein
LPAFLKQNPLRRRLTVNGRFADPPISLWLNGDSADRPLAEQTSPPYLVTGEGNQGSPRGNWEKFQLRSETMAVFRFMRAAVSFFLKRGLPYTGQWQER